MEERPSDMDGGGEYIEYTVADSRHRVALQLGGLSDVLTTPHHKKRTILRGISQGLGLGRALVNAIMNLRVQYFAANFLTS